MENNNNHSVANSRDSSPHSRDADQTTSFDEQPLPPPPPPSAAAPTYKVKFMCSYGGRIQPRPHDNQLSYVGGDTKIVAVDRHIRFAALAAKLSSLTGGGGGVDVCFKYQLPGEDLDALISVTNDEDLDHMMVEYDRLCRSSPRPARLRLILFPLPNNSNNNNASLPPPPPPSPSVLTKPEGHWFVEALNSVQLPEPSISPPQQLPPPVAALNPDFLFGLDKPRPAVSADPSPAAPTVPDFAAGGSDCRPVAVTEAEIVRLHLGSNEQQQQQQRKSDEDNGRVNGVESYSQKNAENAVHSVAQVHSCPVHVSGQVPVHVPGSLLHNPVRVSGTGVEPVPVYLIQTPSGIYQAVRSVTGPMGPSPVYLIQATAAVSHPAQKVGYGGTEVAYPGGDAWN